MFLFPVPNFFSLILKLILKFEHRLPLKHFLASSMACLSTSFLRGTCFEINIEKPRASGDFRLGSCENQLDDKVVDLGLEC